MRNHYTCFLFIQKQQLHSQVKLWDHLLGHDSAQS